MTTRTATKPTAPKTRAKALKKSSRAAELLNIVDPAVEAQEQYLAAARERARIYHLREQAIKEGRPVPSHAMPKSARGLARLEARLAAAKGTKPTKGKPVVETKGNRAVVASPKPAFTPAYVTAQAEARARKAAERSDHRKMRELIASGQAQAPRELVSIGQPPVVTAEQRPTSSPTISREQLLATLHVLIASEQARASEPASSDRAHVVGIIDGLRMAERLVRLMGA